MNAAKLEAITREAGDVYCLVNIANELVSQAEAGDPGPVHRLGAVLRALQAQAKALHQRADDEWMAAHRVEMANSRKGEPA